MLAVSDRQADRVLKYFFSRAIVISTKRKIRRLYISDSLTEKESFWHASVGLWEESGLNARQFCKQEGLAYQSFLSWKRRFQETSDSFIELEEIAPLFLI